jgi:hypothetical protein
MSDYQNHTYTVIDVGLNLRDRADAVKQGQWVRLSNVKSSQEALLTTRVGRALYLDTSDTNPVHTIKDLGNNTVLIGVGDKLYYNNTAYATTGYSGDPLSVVSYRPDEATEAWTYIGDANQMRKVHADGRDFEWGITAPHVPAYAEVVTGIGGQLDNVGVPGAIVYDWRYTYASSSTGAESNPSPIMAEASKLTIDGQAASLQLTSSPDPQVDQIKLYRRGGTLTTTWRFLASHPNVSGKVLDLASDAEMALNEELSRGNFKPFQSIDTDGNILSGLALPYVWGPFVGRYILACGDPNRPGYLYWTNALDPDSADTSNNLEVTPPTEPLVGGLIYSALPFLWTKKNLYALDFGGVGTTSGTFVPRATPCGRGLLAPWCFAVGDVIYFLSDDGIYITDGQKPAESITESSLRPLFTGDSVSGHVGIDFTDLDAMRLTYDNRELHFFYNNLDGVREHLSYDNILKRWKEADENPRFTMGADSYFGDTQGRIYTASGTTDGGTAIPVNCRTGSMDGGRAHTMKEYGNLILDANPNGGTITVTPYFDVEATEGTPIELTGSTRQKFAFTLGDTYAYSIALHFSWTGVATIYQCEFLWRLDEEEIKHWEFPPTSHGLSGWMQVRDGYFAIRLGVLRT